MRLVTHGAMNSSLYVRMVHHPSRIMQLSAVTCAMSHFERDGLCYMVEIPVAVRSSGSTRICHVNTHIGGYFLFWQEGCVYCIRTFFLEGR
jgi:hypothetical protein